MYGRRSNGSTVPQQAFKRQHVLWYAREVLAGNTPVRRKVREPHKRSKPPGSATLLHGSVPRSGAASTVSVALMRITSESSCPLVLEFYCSAALQQRHGSFARSRSMEGACHTLGRCIHLTTDVVKHLGAYDFTILRFRRLKCLQCTWPLSTAVRQGAAGCLCCMQVAAEDAGEQVMAHEVQFSSHFL